MKKQAKSEITVPIQVILIAPPVGIDFGVQEGKGNEYKTIQVQRSKATELRFDCWITAKNNIADGPPNFVGTVVQGPSTGRFIYITIGKSAGQIDSCWQRRIKIPLQGITWEMIDSVVDAPKRLLQASIPGTGKDGGPSCATVKPIDGWKVVKTGERNTHQLETTKMESVKHLLSFVTNSEANMLTVHLDRAGISFLIERLTLLRALVDRDECEDCHLFTTNSIGAELSSTKLDGQVNEAIVVQHVKLYAWTQQWAKKHRLLEE